VVFLKDDLFFSLFIQLYRWFSFISTKHLLQRVNADSLEVRRLKFDLVMIYCSVHGLNALDFSDFFNVSNSSTRGHAFKLSKHFSRVNCRAFSFANRFIDVWNSLDKKSELMLMRCATASV